MHIPTIFDFETPRTCAEHPNLPATHVYFAYTETPEEKALAEAKGLEYYPLAEIHFMCTDEAESLLAGYFYAVNHLDGTYCPFPLHECPL